jgi:hypothetical protein
MGSRSRVLIAIVCCCGQQAGTAAAPPERGAAKAADAGRELVFIGMCDASGAVPLSDRLFAVADDEDNRLRVYDALKGGAELWSVELSDQLGLPARPRRGKKKPKPPKPPPEVDIEAATRIGDLALWLTSHARASSGKPKPERSRMFATTARDRPSGIELVGGFYQNLLADLLADPRYAAFNLAEAAERAPKDAGGLNIEGLTERQGGGVFIGFRNPIPAGKALLAVLENPLEVIRGRPARLGAPMRLDLGGLGVRALSWWHGQYLVIAGHYDDEAASHLFVWDGKTAPRRLEGLRLERLNPEGFFTPESANEIMLLSDDGSVVFDGTPCKRLEDPRRKQFRGTWIALPSGNTR